MAEHSNTKDDFYVEGDELTQTTQVKTEEYSPADYEGDENITYSRKNKSDNSENSPKGKFNFRKLIKVCLIAVIIFAFVIGAGAVLLFNMPQNVVFDGITCEGTDLGNMTYEQALSVLQSKMNVNIAEITVSVNEAPYTISAETIGLAPLAEETAKKVFAYDKDNNTLVNAYRAITLKIKGVDILPVTTLNEEILKQELIKIGNEALGTLTPYTVEVSGTTAQLIPGKKGFDLNTDKAVQEIKDAISQDIYNHIPLTMKVSEPEKLKVEDVEKLVNVPASNAAYPRSGNNITVTSEKSGLQIDKSACETALSQLTLESAPISVPCQSVAAEKTAESLKSKMFNYILGTYSTTYAAGGNRGSNIANAAARMNGTVLLPGEEFSFNKVVGKRTEENGFKSAPEYQNGTTVTGIGGGTCQVSTTLYSAVLYADLKIVSRRNHSMSVGYAPLGQDATVTNGGIDLKFSNDTEYPIKIDAIASGGKITVKIIGTEPDVERTVKITHTNVPSATGKSVKTIRTVYDTSGNVLKTDNLGVSKYKPHS